jgi:hypothetical protein
MPGIVYSTALNYEVLKLKVLKLTGIEKLKKV